MGYTFKRISKNYKVIDFMRDGKIALILSSVFVVVSIISMSVRGFNFGLDFTGGVLIEVILNKPIELDDLRRGFDKTHFHNVVVKTFDNVNDLVINLHISQESLKKDFLKKVVETIRKIVRQEIIIKRVELVGPNVGSDLKCAGIVAIFSAFFAILIYMGFRFEWHLALAIVIALMQDVIITMGILSLLGIEVDLTILASLLSVIGYSLNDKIVVSDRIRENFRKVSDNVSSYVIINISLTQTLARTFITSFITLIMIFILFLFGGLILKGFSSTMLIGVIVGTISSIYISSNLALKFGMQKKHFLIKKVNKEALD